MKNCSLYQRKRRFVDLGEVARSYDICDGVARWRSHRRTKTCLLHDTTSQEFIARRTNSNNTRLQSRNGESRVAPASLKTIIKASRGRVVAGFVTEWSSLSVAAFEQVSGIN